MVKKEKEMKNSLVERRVYFYKVDCACNGNRIPINNLFDKYIDTYNGICNNIKGSGLVISFYDKFHFLEIVHHQSDNDIYQGRFYSLRSNDFPYLFNLLNGNRQEISAEDDDTLMEQTHFCCIVSKKLIVSEYNFHGARIERLANYLENVMKKIEPSNDYSVNIDPIIIPDYYSRIVNCQSLSKLQFKVANPGLKILKNFGIINGYDVLVDNLDSNTDFYVDIEISGGRKGTHLQFCNISAFLQKLVNMIKIARDTEKDAEDGSSPLFKKARLRGFDTVAGKIIPYDLLDEKLVHTECVAKISDRSKYVDSDDMFSALDRAYQEQRDKALSYMEQM